MRAPGRFLPDAGDWEDEGVDAVPRRTQKPAKGYRSAAQRKRKGRAAESESAKASKPAPQKARKRRTR